MFLNPKWELIDTYDVVNFKDESFLRYCAIDAAATYKLWEDIQETLRV